MGDHKDEYDRAWAWFSLHAQQRQTNIQFAISLVTALLAGVGYLIAEQQQGLALTLSLLGMMMSVLFYGVDRRNAFLVKLAEGALSRLEAHLNAENDSAGLASRADQNGSWQIKYSTFAGLFHWVVFAIFAGIVVLSAWNIILSSSGTPVG